LTFRDQYQHSVCNHESTSLQTLSHRARAHHGGTLPANRLRDSAQAEKGERIVRSTPMIVATSALIAMPLYAQEVEVTASPPSSDAAVCTAASFCLV